MCSEVNRLLSDVCEHLKIEGVEGLPREWFESKGETPVAQAVSVEEAREIRKLEAEAKQCLKCRLSEERNKVVFGDGNECFPLVCFVGEGPGADEDRIGLPFVGKAGELLTAAITKGMGLERSQVYICNVVKCRPPGNRTPLPDEISACLPYLLRQLELIKPKVVVALGQPAQLTLGGEGLSISRVRGTWREWQGLKIMPTFHPAYILRNPSAKKLFWEDLKKVMAEVGLAPKNEKV